MKQAMEQVKQFLEAHKPVHTGPAQFKGKLTRGEAWDVERLSMFTDEVASGLRVNPRCSERALMVALLAEEFSEYCYAELTDKLVDAADALGDIVYIVCNIAHRYGIPLAAVFDEIHRANMTKIPTDGRVRVAPSGKIMKCDTYVPPDIERILNETKTTAT